jgi:O-antigen/teichoic acid export membrane protein
MQRYGADRRRPSGGSPVLPALRARLSLGDPLVRSSMLTMAGTVVSAGLGYLYWTIAARVASPSQIGYASAGMSLVTGLSLFADLGVCGFVMERLPPLEGRRAWSRLLRRVIWPTSMLAFAITAVVETVLAAGGHSWHPGAAMIVFGGCTASGLAFLDVLACVFVSARRSELSLWSGTALGLSKLLSLLVFSLSGHNTGGLLVGWGLAVTVSCVVSAGVLLPRVRLGPLRTSRPRRWAAADLRCMAGHHLTSIGGLMVPYLLPTLVVYRLDATRNAYFYATWMLGSVFFMISPAVAAALFVEGVRAQETLTTSTRRAFRLLALLMPGPVVAGVFGGRLVLLVFGADYAREGHTLLAILAVAALPDAVSNVGAGVLRSTGHLRWSASLNVAMGIVTLAGAWILLPRMGIVGAGVAWLAAQSLGAVAMAPLLLRLTLWRRGASAARPQGDRVPRPAGRHVRRPARAWIGEAPTARGLPPAREDIGLGRMVPSAREIPRSNRTAGRLPVHQP